jgi:hypothetical protein
MKARALIPLLVVAAAVGGYILFFERGEVRHRTSVFGPGKERIVRLEIAPLNEPKVVLEKSGDEWRLAAPVKGRAANAQVESLLSTISGLEERGRVEQTAVDLAKVGLTKPSLTLSLWTRKGAKPQKFDIGADTPDGQDLYARLEGRKDLLVLSAYVRSQLNRKADDLRDKEPFHFSTPDEVFAFALARGQETIELRRGKGARTKPGAWKIVAPVKADADPSAVDSVLRALQNARVQKFVQESPKDVAAFGLSQPRLTVTVEWRKKNERRTHTDTLLVGGPFEGDQYYARLGGDQPVLALKNTDVTGFDKPLADLRDKRLVRFDTSRLTRIVVRKGDKTTTLVKKDKDWVLQPGGKATESARVSDLLWAIEDLRAEQFVEERAKDLAKYGLNKPTLEVTLAEGRAEKGFIAAAAADGTQYYVKSKGASFVAQVPSTQLAGISAEPTFYERKAPKAQKPAPGKKATTRK